MARRHALAFRVGQSLRRLVVRKRTKWVFLNVKNSWPAQINALEDAARNFLRQRDGAVAVLFSIVALPMLMIAGAAIDYTRMTTSLAVLQQAADSAAIAGMSTAAATRNAVATATLNGALGAAPLTNLTLTFATNADGSFTAKASARVRLLVSVLGQPSGNISVASTAASVTSTTSTTNNKVCILVLDPSASPGLLVNSGVTLNSTNCEIDVASTGSPAATFNSGDVFNVAKICVKGANTIQNGGSISALSTGCATASDPFAGTLPSITVGACTVSNQNYSGANTLSPGVYCGNFNFNGTGALTLNPGLYVFNNAHWNLNSGWTINGTGVTFYFADSNSYIQINGGASMNASAPTSGTYANILMFEPTGLSASSYTINGSNGHQLNGLIYQPSRNITFNSQSNLTAENFTLVVKTLILDTLTWNFGASPKSVSSAGTTTTTAVRLTK